MRIASNVASLSKGRLAIIAVLDSVLKSDRLDG